MCYSHKNVQTLATKAVQNHLQIILADSDTYDLAQHNREYVSVNLRFQSLDYSTTYFLNYHHNTFVNILTMFKLFDFFLKPQAEQVVSMPKQTTVVLGIVLGIVDVMVV